MEQTLRLWRNHKVCDEACSSRFTKNRHPLWIATELTDIPLHPLERGDGVHHSEVRGPAPVGFLCQLRIGEESEQAQTVVERHDDRAFLCKRLAVVHGLRAGAGIVTAAVNPD